MSKSTSGKPPAPKGKKKGGGGGLILFLLYGIGCAAGGVYVDRNHLSKARLWVGSQVQSLTQYGAEQAILGAVDESQLSGPQKAQAREDVEKIYTARREGRLNETQLQQLVGAEVQLEQKMAGGGSPTDAQLQRSLEVLRGLASGL